MIKIKLSDEDFKIAKQISGFIEDLDKIIFPNKSIEVFILDISVDESNRFRYCEESPSIIPYEGELYLIFGVGLSQRMKQETNRRIMFFKDLEREEFFSLEDAMLAISSHELRHRVIKHYPEKSFFPYHSQTENPYFNALLKYVNHLSRIDYPPEEDKGIFQREFDAAVIEHIIVELYHNGETSLDRIAQIIMSGPEELFNKFN